MKPTNNSHLSHSSNNATTVDNSSTSKKTTHAMISMEQLLHWAAIVESSDDAIISKSVDGLITSWNNAAEKLYGYTADEVVGQPVSILMPDERKSEFNQIMQQLRKGKKIDHFDTKRVAKDGQIIEVSITVSPIFDSNGNIIGASKIARDIRERKEQERRRDSFISTVSHELKSPITSQQMFGELLEKKIKHNQHQEYFSLIEKINNQTAKLEKLVTDLLELSRMSEGQLAMRASHTSINHIINDVASDIQMTTSKNIELNLGPDAQIKADVDRIGQVLNNLISNALKYSPGADNIIVSSNVNNDTVEVSVQDFGIGIPKQYQERIFERFFRLNGEETTTFPGMGIGLNFSSEVIRRHNGALYVKSQPNKGSTFTFSLPIVKAQKQAGRGRQ